MELCRWGVFQDNLVLSTGLIMWIGHCKENWKLTYQALAWQRIHYDEELTLKTSAFESLYGGQFTSSTQLKKTNYLEWKKFFSASQNGKYMVNFILIIHYYPGCAKTFVWKSDSDKIFDMELSQGQAHFWLHGNTA